LRSVRNYAHMYTASLLISEWLQLSCLTIYSFPSLLWRHSFQGPELITVNNPIIYRRKQNLTSIYLSRWDNWFTGDVEIGFHSPVDAGRHDAPHSCTHILLVRISCEIRRNAVRERGR
jgi:hypothetical protein